MKVSYNWLSQYIPQQVPIEQLSEILTNIGLEVEAIEKSEKIPGGLEGLIVGYVEDCRPHPDADKLQLTTVNIGSGPHLSIVCGAPNVAAGQKVVVAPAGTIIHPLQAESFMIKKTKIRGVSSEGMICAEDEIGLGKNHNGILILPPDTIPGTPAKFIFNIPDPDFTIHIGLTPNRSDANSHIGVAKDICAYLSHHQKQVVPVVLPDLPQWEQPLKTLPIDFEIEAAEGCRRYAGIILSDVRIGPSPEWLQERLAAVGIAPINNVVDITNFVLQEYGQPLHAFDYDHISGNQIIVRYAKEGTTFEALDNKPRRLRKEDLLICDPEKPLCLAGIFGGAGSGISETTTRVFLESAYFEPRMIRRSSLHHGLRTEAATHFEKGVAMDLVIPALKRAASLLISLAGGHPASPLMDYYPDPAPDRKISLEIAYLNRLCGKTYSPESVKNILAALGFSVTQGTEAHVTVTVPAENPDIHQEADLAEEVLRIDGLDQIAIPGRLAFSLNKSSSAFNTRAFRNRIAQYLADAGLQEIITNSITNSKYYPEHAQIVRLINNLSSELDVMRPEMLESGLEVMRYNYNRKMQDLKLFELGKTYLQHAPGNYEQRDILAIWLSGDSNPQHWQEQAQKTDFYMLKGLVENIFRLSGLRRLEAIAAEDSLSWKQGKKLIAHLRTVPPATLKAFDIRQEVFYGEIYMDALEQAAARYKISFTELPRYPAVKRDLALVLPREVSYDHVAAIARKQKWEALKDFELFDVFEHEKLGKDKKSLALSFTFRLNDRTLTDEEVDQMMKHLMSVYETDLNASVRS